MPSPDFQVHRSGNTISLSGRFDFTTATQALEQVSAQLKASKSDQSSGDKSSNNAHIIDLKGVTNSNSAGLAVMIEWLAIAQRADQQITFENIPDGLHQISTVCQVDSLI